MPFLIPNEVDAGFTPQAQIDSRDFRDILALADSLTGVLSGCAVTAQGTPDMTVAVAAGTAVVSGVGVTVSAGNVTITTADGTNPRIDLICVDNTGTKSAVAGTAAASPVFPDPAGKCVIAAVYVPASDTAINTNQITDKRVSLSPFVYGGKPSLTVYTDSFLDAFVNGTAVTVLPVDNSDTFYAYPVLSPVTITSIAIYVTVAGTASTLARLGLYRADANWYPTSLVVDAGTVAIDTTGEKVASISATRLAPGRYLGVLNHNDTTGAGTTTFKAVRVAPHRGSDISASLWPIEARIARTFGAFPGTGSGTFTVPGSSSSATGLNPIYFGVSEAF